MANEIATVLGMEAGIDNATISSSSSRHHHRGAGGGGGVVTSVHNVTDAAGVDGVGASSFNHWPTILLVSFSIVTVTINLLLLLLFTRRRSLRTVSNRFVINLLFICLTSSILLVPFVILDLETESTPQQTLHDLTEWENVNFITSLFAQFILNFICTASILGILLIGIDQYLAVLHPLRCHSYLNKPKSLLLIVLTYLLSLTSSTLGVISNEQTFFTNLGPNLILVCSPIWSILFGCIYLTVIIIAPFMSICIIYVLIYRAAHRNSERLRKTQFETPRNANKGLPKVASAPSFINHQLTPELEMPIGRELKDLGKIERTHSDRIPNIITSLKTKISNASAFRYREENRTAKISILVIVMVLVCYGPYGIMYLINSSTCFESVRIQVPNRLGIILLISSNLWSPILFALRNRRVLRELKRFLFGSLRRRDDYGINRRHSRPQIVIQHIETKHPEAIVQIEPFLGAKSKPDIDDDVVEVEATKSILKRVCSKNWSSYKKCSFINVPDGCLDARGSFSSASTQISTEE